MSILHSDHRQLLLVGVDKHSGDQIEACLDRALYEPISVPSWSEARQLIQSKRVKPEAVFLSLVTPRALREHLVKVCSENDELLVVAVSPLKDPQNIVMALRNGAKDYICQPIRKEDVRRVLSETIEVQAASPQNVVASALSSSGYIFESSKMRKLLKTVAEVARHRVPVLIQGETGVGKGVIAKLIYQRSKFCRETFVALSCGAMPADLVESELFGYAKGAFTGAHRDRPGKFEAANGGTIFLDEIGELAPQTQTKLLQVLQDGSFSRLGSSRETRVSVRVIAATNRNLQEAVAQGDFREDLFYRLNVIPVLVPPLRDRKEEIPQLCNLFLNRFRRESRKGIPPLPPNILKLFEIYDWPGNVRELENLMKLYSVLKNPDILQAELDSRLSRQSPADVSRAVDVLVSEYLTSDQPIIDLKHVREKAAVVAEKASIKVALRRNQWNKWRAAKELRVSYKTFLKKVQLYGMA